MQLEAARGTQATAIGLPFDRADLYTFNYGSIGNWTERAGAAMAGIYGNDAVEALYPLLAKDSHGDKPDAGQLPTVNAFWSVTMYDSRTQLLIENATRGNESRRS